MSTSFSTPQIETLFNRGNQETKTIDILVLAYKIPVNAYKVIQNLMLF